MAAPLARNRFAAALLPALVLTSGFCGISYEILYTKLLGNLLGNQFAINAAVLLTFLLGIGIGTLLAHRFLRWLWLIEASIGLYAAGMVLAYPALDRLIYGALPTLGASLPATVATSLLLLAAPAVLIGGSLPIFAAYLTSLRDSHVFSITYAVYNVGAALTALALEFVLLRAWGLRTTTLALCGLNLVVAGTLLAMTRSLPLVPLPPTGRIRFPASLLAALAVASVGSAVFQLLMIKLTEFVLGPYNETFALVLATVLIGLALGSACVGRFGLSFRGALLLCLAGLGFTLAALPTLVVLYAALYPAAAGSYPALVLLKFSLVFALMGVPAVGFGATIPALLGRYEHVARESGQLLFVSSLANAFGFLLMAFVLHRLLDYGALLLLVAAAATAALWIHGGPRRAALVGLGLLALAGLLQRTAWNEGLLYLGHTSFHSIGALRHAGKERVLPAERYKGAEDVFAIVERNGEPHFFINGYFSIPLASTSEKIVGALSSMLAPRGDDALVLGVGSGATAGTVGLVFERTDAVEINAVVLENLHRMTQYNFDIERQPGTKIVHDDGVRFVKSGEKRYSLILNTVTTPLYFSSSKLYTRDFLAAVRARLQPDGVYVTWLDWRVGDRGVDIILSTLSEQFGECWIANLTKGYFLLACSNAPMRLHRFAEVAGNPTLRAAFESEYELPLRLIPYAVLSTEALPLRSPGGGPINTFDRPVLEHEMARLQANAEIDGFEKRLAEDISLGRLRGALGRSMPWTSADFNRYQELREREMRERVERSRPDLLETAPAPR
jgi:spermidine synthase